LLRLGCAPLAGKVHGVFLTCLEGRGIRAGGTRVTRRQARLAHRNAKRLPMRVATPPVSRNLLRYPTGRTTLENAPATPIGASGTIHVPTGAATAAVRPNRGSNPKMAWPAANVGACCHRLFGGKLKPARFGIEPLGARQEDGGTAARRRALLLDHLVGRVRECSRKMLSNASVLDSVA
jgi:hypothetical protein